MKRIVVTLLLAILIGFSIPSIMASARIPGIAILVDLSHGQRYSGLDTIMKMIPEASWIILVASEDDANALPDIVRNLATDIWVGDFASVDLGGVDVIIIGQPTVQLSPDEINAIASWFTEGGKVLWVAADSDYPAGGSELAQYNANLIMEAIGSNLRVDYSSVEDVKSNCGKPYRVAGIVNPSPGAEAVAIGTYKVLFHGPGPVGWVDDAGNWHKLTEEDKPDNVYILVTTTDGGRIAEHQPKEAGGPGYIANVYKPGDAGVFTLMAAQVLEFGDGKSVVLLSGESPYGGYQPMVTWNYYNVILSGPTFIRNVILWATGYMGYLSTLEQVIGIDAKLADIEEKLNKTIDELKSELNSTIEKVVSGKTKDIEGKVDDLSKKVSEIESRVGGLDEKIKGVEDRAQGTYNIAAAGLGVGVVALLIALAAILMARKPSQQKVAGKIKK